MSGGGSIPKGSSLEQILNQQGGIDSYLNSQDAAGLRRYRKQGYNNAVTAYPDWQRRIGENKTRAIRDIGSRLQEAGYAPEQYQQYMDQYIGDTMSNVSDPGAPTAPKNKKGKLRPGKFMDVDKYANLADPSAMFNSDAAIQDIMNRIEGKKQAGFRAEADTMQGQFDTARGQFDPYKLFADTADDQYINQMLDQSYNDALQWITRASARGQLTDLGKQRAMSELGNQRTAANTRLQTIGGDILNTNRMELSDLMSNIGDQITNFRNTGQKFDLTSALSNLQNRSNTLTSNLQGSLLNAVDTNSLFTPQKAINRGGGAQGGINPAFATGDNINSSLSGALADANKRRAQTRQLGSSGPF